MSISQDKRTISRAKGGTAEREEAINEIEIPDLWFLIQGMKQGIVISKREGKRLVGAIEETWLLAHDLKKHIQQPSPQEDK
jgi:hypothetical protein